MLKVIERVETVLLIELLIASCSFAEKAKVDLKDWGLAQSVRCLGQRGVA